MTPTTQSDLRHRTFSVTDDSLVECDECGHLRYHHRPNCTHIDGVFSYTQGVMCKCAEFVEPREAR